jgi:tetratricopeptide (TPR) repeat protein
MPSGTFNIAIASMADTDGRGQQYEAQRGRDISAMIGRALARDNAQSPYGSANVAIWYDDLPRAQKATHLGIVAGASPEQRRQAAATLADRVGADVVIYGTIAPDNRLVPEFYVKQQPRIEYDANTGSYQLGDTPIAVDPSDKSALESAVTKRAGALFWLIKGLQFSSRGETEHAIAVWNDATLDFADWDGGDTLFFLKGQAALFSAQRETNAQTFDSYVKEATAAFDQAIKLNPNNARAYIGRGSVYKTLADRMAPAERVRSPLIPQAIRDYQRASELAPQAFDRPRAIGESAAALGSAYRLLGDTYLGLAGAAQAGGDAAGAAKLLGVAEQHLDTAIADLRAALDPLGATQDHRLLGQAYLALGNAASQKAIARGMLADVAGQKEWNLQASGFYQSCIDQGQQQSEDTILLNDIIEQRCKPYKRVADQKAAGG